MTAAPRPGTADVEVSDSVGPKSYARGFRWKLRFSVNLHRAGLWCRCEAQFTGAMAIQDVVEIERKFDVEESSVLPAFDRLPGVASVEDSVEYALDATYFDTADLALATSRITLRRRTGGEDEGWHLKTLLNSDTRQEFREPLGSDPITVPERLLRRVRVHVRDRALVPVVRLQTRRIVHRLLDADGAVPAEICDDRVRADRFVPEAETQQWREWEVELVGGDLDLLDAAQSLLETSGVTPSAHVSKLARALGDLPGARPSAPPRVTGKSAAGDVLLACVDTNVRMLRSEDPRVREDEPDSVHQMRIALRRLRSALTTFRPIVDAEVANFLRGELKWMARTLGAARDLQVLHQRLRDLIAAEPPELVLGPVSDRIDGQLSADAESARRSGLESLDDERYFRLLDALDSFLTASPLRRPAAEPAPAIVPDLIDRQWKRLRARVRESKKAATGSPATSPCTRCGRAPSNCAMPPTRPVPWTARPPFGWRSRPRRCRRSWESTRPASSPGPICSAGQPRRNCGERTRSATGVCTPCRRAPHTMPKRDSVRRGDGSPDPR